ncbi:MAG: hypothetical protein PHE38_10930 [Alishewanella agri]|jgi:hypothetical protein|uniref:Uncharacterized protein n=1 Tax=Alishewanella jeotgali KCTC 22429 TaxID=1129374 RepID=H3ZIG6_9ALTE|nr:hypothetical protein [Alishewanella jeotgali]EHR39616.1 hypothetical protein AJE_15884 [Alishewanella jeotgali KCTC 22429]MDD4864515.1 hypothetical protein [Alishewanella agri]
MGRNWDWSFKHGIERRLEAEILAHKAGTKISAPPLHSHDATMQSQFERGWHSVTPVEIQRAINPPPSIGEALRQNQRLRDILGI